MEPVVHTFDPPERFVAGTVGQPGARTFFLQARSGRELVSVACEKEQVVILAERVDQLLDRVMTEGGTRGVVPAVAPQGLRDDAPLEQPIEEEFRVGTITLSWDPGAELVAIELMPLVDEGQDEDLAGSVPEQVVLVRLPPGVARAFVERAGRVVSAGRPDCPFCGRPIDPSGHLCVRANGFKRRDP